MKSYVLDSIPIVIPEKSLLSRIGRDSQTNVSKRILKDMKQAVNLIARKAKPRAVYRIIPVETNNGSVTFDEHFLLKSRKLKRIFRPCQKAVIFLTTIGPQVDALIQRAMKKKPSYGYILDSVASVAAESTADYLEKKLKRKFAPEHAVTLRYSPGYCDWPLSEQKNIFKIIPGNLIGVKLSERFFMMPYKSISGAMGVCPADSSEASRNACLECQNFNCPYRRSRERDVPLEDNRETHLISGG